MSYLRTPMTAIAVALLAVYPAGAMAQDRAGYATKAQPGAFQKTGFSPITMTPGSEVYSDGLLYTTNLGSMDVRFDDGTKLTLSPNSRITVDQYVYNPVDTSGEMLVSLSKGALRFVSGKVRKERVRVNTGVATIGIRGTDFTLQDGDDELSIWVDEGTVIADPTNSDQTFTFDAPAFAVCTATGCDVGEPNAKPEAYPDPAAGSDPPGSGGDAESSNDDAGDQT
ncbi:MAG: FecR family protein [Pseudomonadota bacterium]